jgi:hypothetical protein
MAKYDLCCLRGCQRTKPSPLLGCDSNAAISIEERSRVQKHATDRSIPSRDDPFDESTEVDPVQPHRPHRTELQVEAIDKHIDRPPCALIAHANSFPQRPILTAGSTTG